MLCNRGSCLWCQPSDPLASAPKGEFLVRSPSRPQWPCDAKAGPTVRRSRPSGPGRLLPSATSAYEECVAPAQAVPSMPGGSSFQQRSRRCPHEGGPSESSSPRTTWPGSPADESFSKSSSSGADPRDSHGSSGEACSGFYKNWVQNDTCMGPDTLAVDECLVEIDLSAEFPPERREAQEDLLLAHIQRERPLTPVAPASSMAADWWADANPAAIKGLQEAVVASRLLGVRVVRPAGSAAAAARGQGPWHPSQAEGLYKAMGMRGRVGAAGAAGGPAYVALWLNLSTASLLCFAEALDCKRLEAALAADDPLAQRLKLILNPLRLTVPWPQKAPKDVGMLGAYFGPRNASCMRGRTSGGVDYVSVHIDLHAKMLLRLLLQNVVFRKGNVIELLVVDWPGKAVLASIRLTMTKEALQLLGPERNPKGELSL